MSGRIIPTDEVHHFSEGLAATTNQVVISGYTGIFVMCSDPRNWLKGPKFQEELILRSQTYGTGDFPNSSNPFIKVPPFLYS